MLTLPIKKKWFDMILSGEKKEEYREIKPYYTSRFINLFGLSHISALSGPLILGYKPPEREIRFRNGYSKKCPSLTARCTLGIGYGEEEWGAEPNKEYYVLKILEIKEVRIWDYQHMN